MGKLVRDRIPDIIRASGRSADVRRLDDGAYRDALHAKLAEEAAELRDAEGVDDKLLEEAADVLEVLVTIATLHGHTLGDVIRAAGDKRSERGGFAERLWLESF